jgi:hypothetical protein
LLHGTGEYLLVNKSEGSLYNILEEKREGQVDGKMGDRLGQV